MASPTDSQQWLDWIWALHSGPVFAYAARRVGRGHAEDVVGGTFMGPRDPRAPPRRPRGGGPAPPRWGGPVEPPGPRRPRHQPRRLSHAAGEGPPAPAPCDGRWRAHRCDRPGGMG